MQGKGRKQKTETVPTMHKKPGDGEESQSPGSLVAAEVKQSSPPENGEPQRKKQDEVTGQGTGTR